MWLRAGRWQSYWQLAMPRCLSRWLWKTLWQTAATKAATETAAATTVTRTVWLPQQRYGHYAGIATSQVTAILDLTTVCPLMFGSTGGPTSNKVFLGEGGAGECSNAIQGKKRDAARCSKQRAGPATTRDAKTRRVSSHAPWLYYARSHGVARTHNWLALTHRRRSSQSPCPRRQ